MRSEPGDVSHAPRRRDPSGAAVVGRTRRVAPRRTARVRSRVDLRPPGVAVAPRWTLVRRHPDPRRRRYGDGADPARDAGRIAELPASRTVRPRAHDAG